MAKPKGGARVGAGRKPGIPNKSTIQKVEAAVARVEAARASGKKLAIEVIEEFMHLFAGMSAHHQPIPPGQVVPTNRDPNEGKFLTYAKLTLEAAGELAAYQSPKLRAIAHYLPPPPGSPGAVPLAQPGDDAKVVGGNVTRIDDPNVLVRVYREIMVRPKG